MNIKTCSLSVFAAVLCLTATSAGAAEPGFYVTASLGQGVEDPKVIGNGIVNSEGIIRIEPDHFAVDDGDTTWSVGLGYRISKYFSGELEYIDFGTTNLAEHYTLGDLGLPFPIPAELNWEYSSHVTGPAVSLLGTLPVGENFELFLRGGALFGSRELNFGSGDLDEKFSSTVWLAGAGVTWSCARRWGIRAEFQQTGKMESMGSSETSLQRMSLSVLFKL